MDPAIFENLSVAADVGVTVLGASGETRFESSLYAAIASFLKTLRTVLDIAEADRVSLIYGCYQSRRFGGRYIFFTPSGLAYCASPLTCETGEITSGVLAGPFLMTDREEYMDIDIIGRHSLSNHDSGLIRDGLHAIAVKTPAQAHAISEQLHICASYHSVVRFPEPAVSMRTDALAKSYPIDKEDELLTAISMGDVQTAGALLNNILGQILFNSGGDLEITRSRVVELTVLLSRAALKGGANIGAIFGLNYSYLREIDALNSSEDIVLWLHGVTRRFAQHVFDYANAKHIDVIYKAITYIKKNYSKKITLQDVSDHVFLSLTYFSKIFKEETRQTPGAYITAVRIENGRKLLRDSSVNIADIPELIGFESQSYFTQVFKKAEGCTPGRFRQKHLDTISK